MAKVNGPKPAKRKTIRSVAYAKLMYAAPICDEKLLETKQLLRKLETKAAHVENDIDLHSSTAASWMEYYPSSYY